MRGLPGSVFQFGKADLLGTLLQLLPIQGVGQLDQAMGVRDGDGRALGAGKQIGLARQERGPPGW